jgi:diguanylate cyclase (GGDEF)-like protein
MQGTAFLRHLFARRDDPYAGADITNAKRLGSVLTVIGTAITLALIPAAPPGEAIGEAGWAVAGALVVLSLAAALAVGTKRNIGFRVILVAGWAVMAQIAVIQWLAGGDAPYEELFLLAFIFTAAVHPPRVAAATLAFGSVAYLAPLLYADLPSGELAGQVVELGIWWGLSIVTMALMTGVRAQRLQEQQASRLARVDELTGLGNRRAFDEALEREVSRADRAGAPLALLLVDIDDFKTVNDDYGHPTGDECLRGVADALRLTVRAHDHCFRWGGDEFAVLLPETSSEGAGEVCWRLAETVLAAGIGPDKRRIDVTCGVACLPDATSGAELVGRADMALLRAKHDAGARGPRVIA